MRWRNALIIAGAWHGGALLLYGWITRWCFCSVTGAPRPRTVPDAVIAVLRFSEYPLALFAGVVPLDWVWALADPVPVLLFAASNVLLTTAVLVGAGRAVRGRRRSRLDRSAGVG